VPYVPSEASYDYSAELPTGQGWSGPIESHPTDGALLRTEVRSDAGAFLIIDRTPYDVPQLGGAFDQVTTLPHPEFGSATKYVLSSSEALPECEGSPCVDFLISDHTGGGWGVLAGGPDLQLADAMAARVMSSISWEGQSRPPSQSESAGTYTSGDFTFTDVQVRRDFVGEFEVRTRVTNNGEASDFVDMQATLFDNGSVVSDLQALESFEANQTRTVTFIGTDKYGPWDAIEFTVDEGF
jgi:hypothetical protein